MNLVNDKLIILFYITIHRSKINENESIFTNGTIFYQTNVYLLLFIIEEYIIIQNLITKNYTILFPQHKRLWSKTLQLPLPRYVIANSSDECIVEQVVNGAL